MRTLFEDTDVGPTSKMPANKLFPAAANPDCSDCSLWLWEFHHWQENRKPPAPSGSRFADDNDSQYVDQSVQRLHQAGQLGRGSKLLASSGQQRLDDEKKTS
jgi:hypothetical protein